VTGRTGPRRSRAGLQAPWLKGAAQLALLAAPAWLARPCGDGRSWPARIAQLPEDLAQPVVDCLQDHRPLGEVDVLKRGERLDGRVDAGVTGGGQSRPNSFRIHCVFYLLR
jgi:hypothetical protein